jgi:hypothetical protein
VTIAPVVIALNIPSFTLISLSPLQLGRVRAAKTDDIGRTDRCVGIAPRHQRNTPNCHYTNPTVFFVSILQKESFRASRGVRTGVPERGCGGVRGPSGARARTQNEGDPGATPVQMIASRAWRGFPGSRKESSTSTNRVRPPTGHARSNDGGPPAIDCRGPAHVVDSDQRFGRSLAASHESVSCTVPTRRAAP